MGFDLFLHAVFMLCPKTGKPYYFVRNSQNYITEEYDLTAIVIPDIHRRFLKLRGGVLHAYTTRVLNDTECTDVIPATLLDVFPSWEDVKNYDPDCESYWTEAEHNGFKRTLEWMNNESTIEYRVSWSY